MKARSRRLSAENVVQLHPPASVTLATITGRNNEGDYLVTYAGQTLPARSTIDLKVEDLGKEVTLVFIHGDPSKPVISGLLRNASRRRTSIALDGERMVLTAEQEIILECGKSKLVLRRDGKVVLTGADILSRSSGSQRIKGSTVLLN